jgi:type I restriction enzyme, S subunit
LARVKTASLRRLLVEATWSNEWPPHNLNEYVADALLGLDRGRQKQNIDGVGFAYLKMGNVAQDGRTDLENVVYVDASPVEVARYSLSDGDLLFNTRNSRELVGKTGIVQNPPSHVVFNNNLLRIRLAPSVRPKFLCYQFQTIQVQHQLAKMKSGTTNVAAIYQRDLMGLTIRVPDLATQDRVVSNLETALANVDELLRVADKAEGDLGALRAGILASAFAGRLSGPESA